MQIIFSRKANWKWTDTMNLPCISRNLLDRSTSCTLLRSVSVQEWKHSFFMSTWTIFFSVSAVKMWKFLSFVCVTHAVPSKAELFTGCHTVYLQLTHFSLSIMENCTNNCIEYYWFKKNGIYPNVTFSSKVTFLCVSVIWKSHTDNFTGKRSNCMTKWRRRRASAQKKLHIWSRNVCKLRNMTWPISVSTFYF